MDVSIAIVSYNTRDLLRGCIESLRSTELASYEIIIVDNASRDDSVEWVAAHHPDVRVIANRQNVGFAAAVNQASRFARGRYLFLLNPDTTVAADAVGRLVAFMDAHPEVGVCAPAIFDGKGDRRSNYQNPYSPWTYCVDALTSFLPARLQVPPWRHTAQDVIEIDDIDPTDVGCVYGCALMSPVAVFDQVGALDESYFMYLEDIDYCIRVARAGWRITVVPLAHVAHLGGQSSLRTRATLMRGQIGRHLLQSRFYYVGKFYGRRWAWIFRACGLTAAAGWLLATLVAPDANAWARRMAMARLWWSSTLNGASRPPD